MESLRISTMTAVGELDANINLNNFLSNLFPNDFIRYIETEKGNKGYAKKNDKKKRKITNKRKLFFNQGTLILNLDNKLINLKIFSNNKAKIQITGLLSKEQGLRLMDRVIDYIIDMDSNFTEEQKIFNTTNINLTNFRIVMMNSDYDFKFQLDRELLFYDLLDEGYYTTYSPDGYPGVNSKYFWNKNNDTGVCNCTEICNGKGCGEGNGQCRRVTMAIFQSGKMIITGAQKMEQVKDSFHFINDFVLRNKNKYILR